MDISFLLNLTVLSKKLLVVHSISMLITLLAFVFAGKLLALGRDDAPPGIQVLALRLCIFLYFSFEFVDIFLLHALPQYNRPLYKGALSLLTIFLGIIISNIFNKWSIKKFGAERKFDGATELVATYYSRLTSLLFSTVLTMMVIYVLVEIWEMDSLLETTGFVGLIVAALVFTNSIWLPDLYYGLVILNSNMFGDGDAILLENGGGIYVINRVSLVYTSLLNIENNNKAVLRNSKIFENKVENLTRRASIEGLRQNLQFKVSYPNFQKIGGGTDKQAKLSGDVDKFFNKLEIMFQCANDDIHQKFENCIAKNSKFDWGIVNTGDHALELVMHYYLPPLPSTKLSKKIREILFGTRQKILYTVYKQSVIFGIELSTPTLVNIDNLASRMLGDINTLPVVDSENTSFANSLHSPKD